MMRLRGELGQFNRDTLLTIGAEGLLASAFQGVRQLLAALYILRLGHGPDFVGLYSAVGALSFSLSSIPGAALGRRLGTRPVMIAGAAANIVGMALLQVVEMLPAGWQGPCLLVSQLIAAGGWSVLEVNTVGAVAATTAPHQRLGAYALKQGSLNAGMLAGTIGGGLLPAAFAGWFGGSLDDAAPYRNALAVCIVLGLAGMVPLLRLRRVESAGARVAVTAADRPPTPMLAGLAAVAFLCHSALAGGKAFYSAYLDRGLSMPTSTIGMISSAGLVLAVLGSLNSARLGRRSSGQMMVLTSLGLSGSLLLMSAMDHWLPVSVGTIGAFALPAMWMPAFQSLQMEICTPAGRATVVGICSTAMSLGFATMSLGGGRVARLMGYRSLFALAGLVAAASAALLWGLMQRRIVAGRS